jgi:hypothetical protein
MPWYGIGFGRDIRNPLISIEPTWRVKMLWNLVNGTAIEAPPTAGAAPYALEEPPAPESGAVATICWPELPPVAEATP